MPDTSYDPRTQIGYVRLLISDTHDADSGLRVFSDAEVEVMLSKEQHPKRAAAALLTIVAGNEALVSKVIRSQDYSSDGAKVAEVLLKTAERLADEADADTLAAAASRVEEFDPDYLGRPHAEFAEHYAWGGYGYA